MNFKQRYEAFQAIHKELRSKYKMGCLPAPVEYCNVPLHLLYIFDRVPIVQFSPTACTENIHAFYDEPQQVEKLYVNDSWKKSNDRHIELVERSINLYAMTSEPQKLRAEKESKISRWKNNHNNNHVNDTRYKDKEYPWVSKSGYVIKPNYGIAKNIFIRGKLYAQFVHRTRLIRLPLAFLIYDQFVHKANLEDIIVYKDGNPRNCHPSNLEIAFQSEWDTQSYNFLDPLSTFN